MVIQQIILLDLFLYEFVGNSTDIVVMVTTFLIHMSVLAEQGAPVPCSTKFSMNRGLNSEIGGKVGRLIEGYKLRVGLKYDLIDLPSKYRCHWTRHFLGAWLSAFQLVMDLNVFN